MKKNLEIIEVEAKLDKNEKKYWRVKTNEGWMTISSWEETLAKQVSKYKGQVACVEVTEKDGTNYKGEPMVYKNIVKCYGEADEIEMIADEKPEVVKIGGGKFLDPQTGKWIDHPPQPKNNHATMYTSYAKDIFCALNTDTDNKDHLRQQMDLAIELVKQAKEAFE